MVCLKTAPERVRSVFIHILSYCTTLFSGLQGLFQKKFLIFTIFFELLILTRSRYRERKKLGNREFCRLALLPGCDFCAP